MIDADNSLSNGQTFWEWFQYWYVRDGICSRQDAVKRMALARSDDPEGALAAERRKTRERVAAHRAKASDAYNDDVRVKASDAHNGAVGVKQDQQQTGGEDVPCQ